MFPARFELATFRVLGGRDNHYTTETTVYNKGRVRGIIGILSLGRKCKFIPLLWYKVVGGRGGWRQPLPGEFLICCSNLKRFYLQWKTFHLLNKMRDILGVVVLLKACDVTNNGRHFGFYQELEIRLKPQEMLSFCALYDHK